MRSERSIPEWSDTIHAESELMLFVIDMQKLFLTDEASPWADADLLRIVPPIKSLFSAAGADRALFTRFAPPQDWQCEKGCWRTYYYYNRAVTTEVLGTEALEVIDELVEEIGDPASRVADKQTISAISSPSIQAILEKAEPVFLVLCGIEIDYCVLATALDALDRGYFVVIPTDACASSRPDGMRHARGILERFPAQVWLTTTDVLVDQLHRKHADPGAPAPPGMCV